MKLEKERELLEKKLDMSALGSNSYKKLYDSKISQNEQKVDRFKDQLQKERERNSKLEDNIKQMRRSINNEFEIRLNREKIKF
jgi:septal ring factor EnvC (AmiA/AmiB activator)